MQQPYNITTKGWQYRKKKRLFSKKKKNLKPIISVTLRLEVALTMYH